MLRTKYCFKIYLVKRLLGKSAAGLGGFAPTVRAMGKTVGLSYTLKGKHYGKKDHW